MPGLPVKAPFPSPARGRGGARREAAGSEGPFAGIRKTLTATLSRRGERRHFPGTKAQYRAWLPSARILAGEERAAEAPVGPHRPAPRFASSFPAIFAPALLLLLAGCAAQSGAAVEPGAPGFLWGLWHGFIFPFAWILSLFMPDVAVYAVPNNGGWYDFGYFIGVFFLGAGAWGARRRA